MTTEKFLVMRDYDRQHAKLLEGAPKLLPWAKVEPLRKSCLRFHGQTLELLNGRGGLSVEEFHMHVHGLKWPKRLDAQMVEWFKQWASEPVL